MIDRRTMDLEWLGPSLTAGFVAMAKTLEDSGQPERIGDIVAIPAPRCSALPNGGWWLKAAIPGLSARLAIIARQRRVE